MIERLGFSEDELLSHAFAMQEVWDVSDVEMPFAMASVRRLTQVAASSDECGDDGMYCATPNIQVPSAEEPERERNRRRAVVEVVIEAKLRAAEVAREAAEKLRLLRQLAWCTVTTAQHGPVAAHLPKKDPGDLRMTIDSRPINACTEPMPNLGAALTFGDTREGNGEYQALVYWLGLDEDEASLEPVRFLYEDIPIVFRRWVHKYEDQEEVKKMAVLY
ncbi:hypothetical protein DYB31_014451 [Aphanomyces astaci]|uniref:Chromo domain-containing protein n=1 Tax=Aphanomyces astaci TaxID=112090 RepID=A0A397ELW9_APHAT|nr:hypothetical protein DYB31_014451 [Aphanomyces astaci]